MMRRLIVEIVLFSLPFVGYFVYRLATRGQTGEAVRSMPWPLFSLTLAGGALVVASFVVFALHGEEEERGRYVPAHTEDGRFVPGQFLPGEPARTP